MLASAVPSTTRDLAMTLLAGAMALSAALIVAPSRASAKDVVVRYDQVTLIKLPKPIFEVVLGNPTIADVSVQGGNLLVITGKSFGVTNIIALDSERNVIQDQRIAVVRDEARSLVVYRGPSRLSYNCAPNCIRTLTLGDDPPAFEDLAKNTEKKLKLGDGESDRSNQSAQ